MKAYLAARLQPEDLEGCGDDHPLLLVIWRRNTFKGLQPLHGGLSTLGLVGHHTTNCTPEDLSGSTEVERSTQRLDVTSQTQKLQVLQLVAVEVSAHVDAFGSDDDNLVTVQDEFGDDGGQTAHQVATAIDYHRLEYEINVRKQLKILKNSFNSKIL